MICPHSKQLRSIPTLGTTGLHHEKNQRVFRHAQLHLPAHTNSQNHDSFSSLAEAYALVENKRECSWKQLYQMRWRSLGIQNVIVAWPVQQSHDGVDSVRAPNWTGMVTSRGNEIVVIYNDTTGITCTAIQINNADWHTQRIWQGNYVHMVALFTHGFHRCFAELWWKTRQHTRKWHP